MADEWTPVSKWMPEDREHVIFYSPDLRNPTDMLLGLWIDGKWMCAGFEMVNVTHWRYPPSKPVDSLDEAECAAAGMKQE